MGLRIRRFSFLFGLIFYNNSGVKITLSGGLSVDPKQSSTSFGNVSFANANGGSSLERVIQLGSRQV